MDLRKTPSPKPERRGRKSSVLFVFIQNKHEKTGQNLPEEACLALFVEFDRRALRAVKAK